jgi:hypothetical protein
MTLICHSGSRTKCGYPESILPTVVMDSGLAGFAHTPE